jgi:hypothetical protein
MVDRMCTHEKQFHYGVELPCAECDKRVVIDIEPLPVGTGPTKAVVQARLLNKPVLVTFVREQRRDAPDRWVEKPAES